MQIYTTLKRGYFHSTHCEDHFTQTILTSHHHLIAVMDGCSMGTESTFASMLISKLLRKIAKEFYYGETRTPDKQDSSEILYLILKNLIQELKKVKAQLHLETNELLSTLILGVVNSSNYSSELAIIGDGLVTVDQNVYEFDQRDKPDYLAYHLLEDFEEWYVSLEKISVKSFKNLSICTDGIFTFKNFKQPEKTLREKEIQEFLLVGSLESSHENSLDQKIRELEEEDHILTDDIAIIQVIAD